MLPILKKKKADSRGKDLEPADSPRRARKDRLLFTHYRKILSFISDVFQRN